MSRTFRLTQKEEVAVVMALAERKRILQALLDDDMDRDEAESMQEMIDETESALKAMDNPISGRGTPVRSTLGGGPLPDHPTDLVKDLGLSFPYAWSNRYAPPEAVISDAMMRPVLEDLAKLTFRFGIGKMRSMKDCLVDDGILHGEALAGIERMLANIQIGMERHRLSEADLLKGLDAHGAHADELARPSEDEMGER